MADVVMLALPAGPEFVRAIKDVWASGDAVFPLDLRLPEAERTKVISAVAPGAVIESDGERRSLKGGRPTAAGDAAVVATSGTTGDPKGVALTHDAMAASAVGTNAMLEVDPASDRWLACLPLAHIGGFSVVTRALITETPLVVHPGFDADATIKAGRDGVTLISLVTRALAQIHPEDFRKILLGGAAPPPNRPANVLATYGLTETSSGCVYERKPMPGVELQFDCHDELQLRGPMLLRAYRNGNDPGLEVDPKDADGWFPTGDIGGFDTDGHLFIEGRKSEVIITGGEKVWPARAEQLLQNQPGVADIALVGRSHPEWGHEVVALVVPEGTGPNLDQLRDATKADLPVWYAPRRLEMVDQLPRTTLGKLQRTKLGSGASSAS